MDAPWLLVKIVGKPRGDTGRALFFRLEEHGGTAPDIFPEMEEGAVLLVQFDGVRWGRHVVLPPLQPWGDPLPYFQAVRTVAEPFIWPSEYSFTDMGLWGIDPMGRPCEFGKLRIEGNKLVHVVNYAGWRLLDLDPERVDLHRAQVEGTIVYLLTDRSPITPASLPEGKRYRTPASGDASSAPTRGHGLPPQRPTPLPALPPPPPPASAPVSTPRAVDLHLAFDQVTWRDEEIEFEHLETGPCALVMRESRAAFEPLKSALVRAPGLCLHVHGFIHPDGGQNLQVDPVPGLREHFELVQRKKLIREVKESDEWLPLDTLPPPPRRPHLGGPPTPAGTAGEEDDIDRILDEQEFPLSARKEAILRLYQHRDPELRPLVWKGAAMLIPLRIEPSTGTVWAWEVYDENHATYLFAPGNDAQLTAVKAWTGQDEPDRDRFRKSEADKAETAFLDRAYHRGTLEEWWQRVLQILQMADESR